MIKKGRMLGVEFKRMDAPKLTPSMSIALSDLGLERIVVVYPGDKQYSLGDKIEVVSLETVVKGAKDIF